MVRIQGYCSLQGEHFSPGAIESKLQLTFDEKNELGEIGVSGRYRGQPIPFGSAKLVFGVSGNGDEMFSINCAALEFLRKNIQVLREAGATEITIHFDVEFTEQCNVEMTPDFMLSVATLGIPLTLTCYESAE